MAKRQLPAKVQEAVAGYAFLLPFLAILVVFKGYPMLSAVFLSFHSYDLFSPPRFVGLANYAYLFTHGDFWVSLRNTATYAFWVVALQTVLAIALALVLDQKLRGKTFFRVAFFLPSVTSSVAISLIFMFIFFKNGVLNQALVGLHVLREPIDWLGDVHTALPAIMAQNIWSTAGMFMITLLAGLQEIPENLYEAARVDGASPAQAFWRITLPLLKPTTFYVVTLGIIGTFQVFDQVYVMTNGGPLKATLTTAYLLYQEAFVNFNMGYACAIAVVLAAIILAVTLVQKKVMGE